MTRKIAIVGTAPSSVMDAPYDDPTWDIWSLGANQVKIKRFTRWFELHTFHALECAQALQQQRVDFFKKIGKDLTIGHENPLLPDAVMYPKDEVIKFIYGNQDNAYFTSSIAWMIALAIYEGASEIGLWGVDMVGDCEYSYQRACCEHLLGIARGRGITVNITPHSPLLRAERMYAFEYTNFAGEVQARILEAKKYAAQADDAYLKSIEDRAFARGVLSVLHDQERKWG